MPVTVLIADDSSVMRKAVRIFLNGRGDFAVNRFECLSWFKGVLLSGQVKVLKPDRRIFEIFLDTFRIEPSRDIHIDDISENVEMVSSLVCVG
jgi:FMN phosphatase YigB (HAD superfamily)